jgi:hypothetical protein
MRPTRPKWQVWVVLRGDRITMSTASTALQKGRARRRAAGFRLRHRGFFNFNTVARIIMLF